jgi:ATP-dependent Clp protease ATP-binding subunit ClpC
MYERFTARARKVMQLANQEAQRFNHEYIGTEHILLGLVKERFGVAASVLMSAGADLSSLRRQVEQIAPAGRSVVTIGHLPLNRWTKRAIECSVEEVRQLSEIQIGTEHLLLGLLHEKQGTAARILINL